VRGVFVTGTDTGAGKSIVAAAICAALTARGERVAAFKPVVTGLDEPPGEWPPDHELLASVASAGQSPVEVAPYRFGPAASPHLAAALEGASIDRSLLLEAAATASAGADVLVVEGVGGLLVPLCDDYLVRDLAAELGLPLIVAARPGLGTINHTLLTAQAARAAGMAPAGIVLTPWPARPSAVEASNRATIERLAAAPVSVLPRVRRQALARAGSSLPLAGWLGKPNRPTSPRSAPPARTPPARTRTARRGEAAAAAIPAGVPPPPAR
jgi:dethiobiotin synthetase